MEEKTNISGQTDTVAIPEQHASRPPMSKLSLFIFGLLILLVLAGIYVFSTTGQNQTEVSQETTAATISPSGTSVTAPSQPTIVSLSVLDTVSFITPSGWKVNDSSNNNPSFIIYESPDFTLDPQSNNRLSGAAFTIFVRPNTTQHSAKGLLTERQKEMDNPDAVIESVQIGNRQGSYSLFRSEGISHAYFVADRQYVWEIQFSCPDECTKPEYLSDRKAFLDSLVFN